MAKELPYFKFEPNQWISGDVTIEALEVQGLFINVCALYWSKSCRLEMAKLKQRYGVAIDKLVETSLIKEKDGFVYINFLNEQWDELHDKHEINSENGKKGANIRWRKNGEANSPPIAFRREEKRREEKNNTAIPVINIPTESDFLKYCSDLLKEKYRPLEFSLKAKYLAWVEDGWKNGHGKKIKNWKTMIMNTIPHLKPDYSIPVNPTDGTKKLLDKF